MIKGNKIKENIGNYYQDVSCAKILYKNTKWLRQVPKKVHESDNLEDYVEWLIKEQETHHEKARINTCTYILALYAGDEIKIKNGNTPKGIMMEAGAAYYGIQKATFVEKQIKEAYQKIEDPNLEDELKLVNEVVSKLDKDKFRYLDRPERKISKRYISQIIKWRLRLHKKEILG